MAGVGNWRRNAAARWVVLLCMALLCWSCGGGAGSNAATGEIRSTPTEGRGGASPSKGSVARYDLGPDEDRGHTLVRHVGKSDAELAERLDRERHISAASTWTDREAAEETIGEALQAEHARVEAWERRGFPRPNLALHFEARRTIGRSLRRGDPAAVECREAVIVLRADGPGSFYVLTAYPEARE